jgi:ATP-dependent RNA helicase SUPV3L1/SUV3
LGVLDRQRVAEEVKGLQQPERASLRKYGVRFGAYHIYVPALLKPGPRALAAQLWALFQAEPQTKGTDELLHLAGSGRTSVPVNREIDANLYRTAGYRVCGERAVRVDILERLADLIRPALAWREGAPGPRPAATFPGGGFTIINGMTSLIGASGEDFASVLRSLGYRMERRPKPVAPAEPAPAAAAAGDTASPPDAAAVAVESVANDPGPVVDETATLAPQPVVDPSAMAAQHTSDAVAAEEKPLAAESAAEPAAATSDQAATTDREAPALIDVWRPGRAEGRQRPRDKRRERHRPPRMDAPAPAVDATTDAQPRPSGNESEGQRSKRPPRGKRGHAHDRRRDRPERPDRERGPPAAARLDRREREKAPDPNSPFAKLAALKAQLEAEAKERR